MKRMHVITLTAAVAAIALAAGSFQLGRHSGASGDNAMSAAPAASNAGDRKVLYWHDPMVPGTRFDKPGKSPFMDMQLVPVYADEAGDSGVKVSPTVQQNLGIRTATVKRAEVSSSFDAVGTVQFDERLNVAVQTRVAGYIERLAVRAPMERVRKGQPLATVFAPDWLAPQNELLALERAGVTPDLIDAARDRMRAMSIPESLIRQSEKAGTAQARFTLDAPVGGVVAELGVREGAAVSPGMTLFRIAGLEKVWAVAEVPE
ncbi:MAG: efflux RND transporter periplasmic adaptor subunit, partial [Rhizobacter sp.]